MRNFKIFLLFLFQLAAVRASDWSELYFEVFAQNPAQTSSENIHRELSARFRLAGNPLKTRLALILMIQEEAENNSSGSWAQWLLTSSESQLNSLAPQYRCRALLQAAAGAFLRKEFISSQNTYLETLQENSCSENEKDFATFQRGWIAINLGQKRLAVDLWFHQLQGLKNRSSLHKIPLLRETTRWAISEVDGKSRVAFLSQLKSLSSDASERSAMLSGALEGLIPASKNPAEFTALQNTLTQLFSLKEIQEVYPSSKLLSFAPACVSLEWLPVEGSSALKAEMAVSCKNLLMRQSRSTRELQLKKLQLAFRDASCISCQANWAELQSSLNHNVEACNEIFSINFDASIFESAKTYCSKKGVVSGSFKSALIFFNALKLNNLSTQDRALSIEVLRLYYGESEFQKAYASAILARKNESEIWALDFLTIAAQNNHFYPDLLRAFLQRPTTPALASNWAEMALIYELQGQISNEDFHNFFANNRDFLTGKVALSAISELHRNHQLGNEEALASAAKILPSCDLNCVNTFLDLSFQNEELAQSWRRYLQLSPQLKSTESLSKLAQQSLALLSLGKTIGPLEHTGATPAELSVIEELMTLQNTLAHQSFGTHKLSTKFSVAQRQELIHYQKIELEVTKLKSQAQKTFSVRANARQVSSFIVKIQKLRLSLNELKSDSSFMNHILNTQFSEFLNDALAQLKNASQTTDADARFWRENADLAPQLAQLLSRWKDDIGQETSI